MTYYDVTLDGERFLMIQEKVSTSSASIDVILNWTEELKRRVPVD